MMIPPELLRELRNYCNQTQSRVFYLTLGRVEHGAEIDKRELLFRSGRRNAARAELFDNPRPVLLCDDKGVKDKKPGHSYFIPIEYKRSRKTKYHRIIRDARSVSGLIESLGIGE